MAAERYLKQTDLAPNGFVCDVNGKLEPVVVESVTSIADNTDATFTYTDESGADTIISLCSLVNGSTDSGAVANTTDKMLVTNGTTCELKTIPKALDFLCNDTVNFPDPIPADPSSYVTLPSPLPSCYFVEVEFTTGYVKWFWDGATWTACGRDFLMGGNLTPAK